MANMIFDVLRRANSTLYKYGELIALSPHDGHVYMCTTAGQSAASPPTYNTDVGSTTTDGTAVFTEHNPSSYLASGVTLSAIKLSLANGFAFVDIGVESVLTARLNSRIVITDSAGKKAIGYIKAAGTGETYSADKVVNGGFGSDVSGWTAVDGTGASVAGGVTGNCLQITRSAGTYQYLYQNIASLNYGGAYYMAFNLKSGTSGNEIGQFSITHGGTYTSLYQYSTSSWAWLRKSVTMNASSLRLDVIKNSVTAGTMLFDTVQLYQILSPSTTGVKIVSSPEGTTRNWASIDSGFNYNDSSGYTVAVDGQPFSGAVQYTQNPRYREYEKPIRYNQAVKRSGAGTIYTYDLGIAAAEGRIIRFSDILDTDLAALINFLASVRAAKFVWQFTDENGAAHKVIITNPGEVANSMPIRNGYSGDVTIEVEFVG